MENTVYKKLEDIELLLKQLNDKIDNFLGFEELSVDEKKDIAEIKSEIDNGLFENFDEVFED